MLQPAICTRTVHGLLQYTTISSLTGVGKLNSPRHLWAPGFGRSSESSKTPSQDITPNPLPPPGPHPHPPQPPYRAHKCPQVLSLMDLFCYHHPFLKKVKLNFFWKISLCMYEYDMLWWNSFTKKVINRYQTSYCLYEYYGNRPHYVIFHCMAQILSSCIKDSPISSWYGQDPPSHTAME